MRRPRSIAEIAERAGTGTQAFDPAVREFIHSWEVMSPGDRETGVTAEPALLGGVKDAYRSSTINQGNQLVAGR